MWLPVLDYVVQIEFGCAVAEVYGVEQLVDVQYFVCLVVGVVDGCYGVVIGVNSGFECLCFGFGEFVMCGCELICVRDFGGVGVEHDYDLDLGEQICCEFLIGELDYVYWGSFI